MTRNYLISGVNTSSDIGESSTSLSCIKSVGWIPECKLNFSFNFSKNGGCIVYTSRFMGVL